MIFNLRKDNTMGVLIDREFQEKAIIIFHAMKFEFAKRPNELTIPIYQQGNEIARLRPVHINFTPKEVRFLAEWRNHHIQAFFTWFVANEEGTKKWLMEQILSREDRILFFMETLEGVPFGHIGLTNLDFSLKTCEIDNVLRGRAELIKGGMTFAFQALTDWVFLFLNANSVYLRVFSDNPPVSG